MKIRVVIGLAGITVALIGCVNTRGLGSLQSVSINGRPFGGTPAVDIPPSAYAMGAYLKAQIAAENGQRAEALKNYESAVRYDPHNAALHVQLADLYVGNGRLKDALPQAIAAEELDPNYIHARLLVAGISSALDDDKTAQQQYERVMQLDPKNQNAINMLKKLR